MAHAFMPHAHLRSNEELITCADQHSPLDKIKELFSVDIGVNHLQDFRPESGKPLTHFDLQLFAVSFEASLAFRAPDEQPSLFMPLPCGEIPSTLSGAFADAHGLRGPPVA